MRNLKIIEWNVKNMNATSCFICIADEIYNKKADIVVLTEYNVDLNKDEVNSNKDFEEKLKQYGYTLKRREKSRVQGETDILIAIKKHDDNRDDIEIDECIHYDDENNYLIAKTVIDGKIVYIVGLRVLVKSGVSSNEEQKSRLEQLDKILSEIDIKYGRLSNVIMVGDYNNYKTYGNENDIENTGEYYKNKDQKIYNLQQIKKLYNKYDYQYVNSTPTDEKNHSYKLGWVKYRYDHIFTRGLNVVSVKYDWNWKESIKIAYKEEKRKEKNKKGYVPDHAILVSEVSF